MIKRIIFTFLGWAAFFVAFAQQDAMFSQYFFNPLYFNPGYAGSRDALSGTLTYRKQWVGLKGGPETEAFSIHTPYKYSHVGLGLQVYNDKAGPLNNMGIAGTYAYWIPVGKYKLAFGLQGMLQQLKLDYDALNVRDQGDNSISGNESSKIIPDANFGVYFYNSRFYTGLSATHLIENKFHLGETLQGDDAKFYRHYYLFAGAVIKLGAVTNFRPSVLLKYVAHAPIEGEVDGMFLFFEKLYLGAGLRSSKQYKNAKMDNQLVGIIEYAISDKFRIGYSYDADLSKVAKVNYGSHEIMLGFDLNKVKTKLPNPRFF